MTNKPLSDLTAEYVRSILDYDPETGEFTWLVSKRRGSRGKKAGCKGKETRIGIEGHDYAAHRLAWLWMTGKWPAAEIDHADCNPYNNKWSNLREATRSQNLFNTKGGVGKSTLKGAQWTADKGKWKSRIRASGREIHIGYYDTAIEAHQAYIDAAKKYHGDFARWS